MTCPPSPPPDSLGSCWVGSWKPAEGAGRLGCLAVAGEGARSRSREGEGGLEWWSGSGGVVGTYARAGGVERRGAEDLAVGGAAAAAVVRSQGGLEGQRLVWWVGSWGREAWGSTGMRRETLLPHWSS